VYEAASPQFSALKIRDGTKVRLFVIRCGWRGIPDVTLHASTLGAEKTTNFIQMASPRKPSRFGPTLELREVDERPVDVDRSGKERIDGGIGRCEVIMGGEPASDSAWSRLWREE